MISQYDSEENIFLFFFFWPYFQIFDNLKTGKSCRHLQIKGIATELDIMGVNSAENSYVVQDD